MSIYVVKAGVSDAFYDHGRFGHQHLGINPTPAMDIVALQIVNALTLNNAAEAVLEMHFPAATISFKKNTLIALSGADFTATINDQPIPLNQPIMVRQDALLQFKKPQNGARLYLGVHGGFKLSSWLNSCSTNTFVGAGGFNGQRLKSGDEVSFNTDTLSATPVGLHPFYCLPFRANIQGLYQNGPLQIVMGRHFKLLTIESQKQLLQQKFTITTDSNRMGYKLQSLPLLITQQKKIISSAVTKGTIQLLPNGQLIILMADHQTTGGYPIVGHIISADVSSLSQRNANESITFTLVSQSTAEDAFLEQQRHLLQLQNACNLQLHDFISINNRP